MRVLWCYDWTHVEVQGIMACKHVATARPPCLACTKPCVPCGTAFGQGCVGGAVSVDGACCWWKRSIMLISDEASRSSGHEADYSTRCKTKHAVLVAFGHSLSFESCSGVGPHLTPAAGSVKRQSSSWSGRARGVPRMARSYGMTSTSTLLW